MSFIRSDIWNPAPSCDGVSTLMLDKETPENMGRSRDMEVLDNPPEFLGNACNCSLVYLIACLFVCLLVCLLACLFACLLACLLVCLFVCLFCLFLTRSFCDPFRSFCFGYAGFFQCRPRAGTAASLWKTFGPWYCQPMRSWRERQLCGNWVVKNFSSLKMDNEKPQIYPEGLVGSISSLNDVWFNMSSSCLFSGRHQPAFWSREMDVQPGISPSFTPSRTWSWRCYAVESQRWSHSHLRVAIPPPKMESPSTLNQFSGGWVVSWQKGGHVSKFESLKIHQLPTRMKLWKEDSGCKNP